MKMTITQSMFHDQFRGAGRADAFSYHGLNALYDHLEDAYDGEYDLDVVELCGSYAEYGTAIEALEDMNNEEYVEEYDEDDAMDDLKSNASVIEFRGGLIVFC